MRTRRPVRYLWPALLKNGLDRSLFEAITRQLEAEGVAVRAGTLVDATLIASASIRHDGEARWAGDHRRKPSGGLVKGYVGLRPSVRRAPIPSTQLMSTSQSHTKISANAISTRIDETAVPSGSAFCRM